MRYYRRRIEAWLKGWKNQPSRKEVESLYKHYREIMDKEVINRNFDSSDFKKLIHIARYADIMGIMTAIQAAFCLGYRAGRTRCE